MNETIAFGTLRALGPVLSVLVNRPWERNPRNAIDNIYFELNGIKINKLVEEAKGVLDKGKGPNLIRFTNLVTILTEAEFYGDIIKHISHHNYKEKINWDNLKNELDNLGKNLRDEIDKHPESQSSGHEKEGESSGHEKEGESSGHEKEGESSGHEKEGEMLPGNVRRRLLYLSCFPKKYVFNRQRISRLLDAYEFIAADSGEPPLQHLVNWLEPAESSWDGDGAPNHFLIGNDVEKWTPTWPESHNLVHAALVESIASIEKKIFHSSLISLGKRNYTHELNTGQFLFLKVLSLRNGRLENENWLKTLSLLKYLDLKYTTVRNCSWLEGLEELEMLDLRHTGVEEIPEKYLEKLGKLQHLLLGYRPNKNENRLAGAKLNTTKLTTNRLKTLRAIRWPNVINVSLEVADLSVTDLKTGDLKEKGDQKSFWYAVDQFENLTRLGMAVTKDSDFTLQGCPAKLKNKLKRLRVEGLHSGLEKLGEFVNLVDLTLASHKQINIDSIPSLLQNLFCLWLYSFCKEKTLTLRVQRFESLKKLVIGDMAEVETVEIVTAAIEAVDTLKLCNLPKLSELIYHDSPLLLRRSKSETVFAHSETEVQKSIFLRGFENIQFDKRPGLKIYHYDMNKQCYQEVHAITT